MSDSTKAGSSTPQRWGAAQRYTDVWVDPEDDPRNSEGPAPDGERATLIDYVTHFRKTLVMKCEGLTPEQLALRSVPPSTLSLLGLLRHLALAEQYWHGWVDPNTRGELLYGPNDEAFDEAVGTEECVAEAYENLQRMQTKSDALFGSFPDLNQRVGPKNLAVRELYVHAIDEYARHCGHADLLRECIDGRIGQ